METQAQYESKLKTLLGSLITIQQGLKSPKSEHSDFGDYNYRTLEKMIENVKPLLSQEKCGIIFKDEVEERNGRNFIKATLTFFNEHGETIETTAAAEIAPVKKKVDESQMTGAASSYARKYAMNALFAIDDTKDADTNEFQQQTQDPEPQTQQAQQDGAQNINPAHKPYMEMIARTDTKEKYDKALAFLSKNRAIEVPYIKEAMNKKHQELTKKK